MILILRLVSHILYLRFLSIYRSFVELQAAHRILQHMYQIDIANSPGNVNDLVNECQHYQQGFEADTGHYDHYYNRHVHEYCFDPSSNLLPCM